jgi:hypothetical protein
MRQIILATWRLPFPEECNISLSKEGFFAQGLGAVTGFHGERRYLFRVAPLAGVSCHMIQQRMGRLAVPGKQTTRRLQVEIPWPP